MKKYTLIIPCIFLLLPGCFNIPHHQQSCDDGSHGACPDGQTIRVKAPPQKIVIEHPGAQAPEAVSLLNQGESQPERAPSGEPERRESDQRSRPTVGVSQQEGVLGTAAALGQVAGFARTTAMTTPLATTNPGGSALGFGLAWIKIPIPVPRIFLVNETPTITIPLNEANLRPMVQPGMMVANQPRPPSTDEIAAEIARRMRAEEAAKARYCPPPATDSAEKQRLEQKLSQAEAQIDKLSSIIRRLDEKLPSAEIK